MQIQCSSCLSRIVALFTVYLLWQPLLQIRAIEINLEQCTLEIGSDRRKPIEITNPWGLTYRVGKNRFLVIDDAIHRFGPGIGKPDWTARSSNGLHLHWLAANDTIAYLAAYRLGQRRSAEYESPPRLQRLDLNTGKWLAPLPIEDEGSGYEPRKVTAVLTNDGSGLFVLSDAVKAGTTTAAYDLRLFKGGAIKPTWSKQFPSAGERPYTGGMLWASTMPQYADSDVASLSWMGERLLFSPEAMQPIRCLNPDTGSEIWQVDRLWEFGRGFTGPSVWAHHIGRFGMSDFDITEKKITEERKTFDGRFRCALAGGPVSMRIDFKHSQDTHRIFAAVVKGDADGYSGYLSDCVLYELGSDGKVQSLITIPQVVGGSQFCSRSDGVVWKCQNDTFVKISPSRYRPEDFMGPGSADLLSNLAWSRRVQYSEPEVWFVSGKAGDPIAFGDAYAYCVPGGGYISRSNELIYTFPIAAVDLTTGVDRIMLLKVPFKGNFPLPENNFSSDFLDDGTECIRTRSFHLLAVTYLAAGDSELEITLATEKERYGVKFDLKGFLAPTNTLHARSSTDPMQMARARAKLLDRKALNETLRATASGSDTAYLKALLEAGADPKFTNAGWTALLGAAAYGTGEMVDILLAAGSDLNARDDHCGCSVLTWAARSNRDAKHKIRSLLKAGANRGPDKDGWNVLMSAAGDGNLEAVELLRQEGFSVSHRAKDGETVLMAGARSGKANIVAVLIKAGADVNATDKEGRTALMQAAEGYSTVGAVEALLKAGADPNLKDKKGRTALQIAEASHNIGATEIVELLKPVTTVK